MTVCLIIKTPLLYMFIFFTAIKMWVLYMFLLNNYVFSLSLIFTRKGFFTTRQNYTDLIQIGNRSMDEKLSRKYCPDV